MPNTIKVSVENPDELLSTGEYGAGALVRVQWAATQTGSFADISGTGSTPTIPIVTLTNFYTGYDPLGTSSTWYQTRYENAGASRVSDWTPAFQVGDETAGLLCSLYDLKQRMGFKDAVPQTADQANRDEVLLDIIREVSADIESFVGQWLAPRPTNPASTMTLNFDVGMDYGVEMRLGYTRELTLTSDQRLVGVRSITSLGIATVSQPETGGAYSAVTVTDVLIRPRPTADGPGYRILFPAYPSGAFRYFYPGYNTVQVTGSFGYAAVPYDIQSVAISAVTRRFLGKETATPVVALGPDGGVQLLADLSPSARATLARYRVPLVA
jgi:hypothetical protein